MKDRVKLYKDFTLNLLYYIDKYYLDYETLSEDTDIYNHYVFCYNKTCDDFLKEDLNFTTNEKLKEYFYTYYYSLYYTIRREETTLDDYINLWDNIFDIENHKNKNRGERFEMFIELYQIFDISINNKKNVLELVE